MMGSPLAFEPSPIRDLLQKRFGLVVDRHQAQGLEKTILERWQLSGCQEFDDYAALVAASEEELLAIAESIMVAATPFFGYAEQFRLLTREVLPRLLTAKRQKRRLSFLSVGCGTGEEAYSLALLLEEHLPYGLDWDAEVLGIDASRRFVERARTARYEAGAVTPIPDGLKARYFHADDGSYRLSDRVQRHVSFEVRNVLDEDPSFWRRNRFDVVLCRDFLIRLTREAQRIVVARVTAALRPGGYLFLAPTVSLGGLSEEYELQVVHEAAFYRKRADAAEFVPPQQPLRTVAFAKLSDWRPALTLFRHARYQEVWDYLCRLSADSLSDREVRLLLAATVAHLGRPAAAETLCRQLLVENARDPDAHFLLALLAGQLGHEQEVDAHLLAAIEWDETFAMPYIQIGVRALQRQQLDVARFEFALAQERLPHESETRLGLFGGGLDREGLVRLCRSHLQRLGVGA